MSCWSALCWSFKRVDRIQSSSFFPHKCTAYWAGESCVLVLIGSCPQMRNCPSKVPGCELGHRAQVSCWWWPAGGRSIRGLCRYIRHSAGLVTSLNDSNDGLAHLNLIRSGRAGKGQVSPVDMRRQDNKGKKVVINCEMMGLCSFSSSDARLSSLKPRSIILVSPTDDIRLLHDTYTTFTKRQASSNMTVVIITMLLTNGTCC